MKMINHKNLNYHLFPRKINIEVYGGNMFYIDILKQYKHCVKNSLRILPTRHIFV